MGISNELSTEIATEILSNRQKSNRELNDLKEIVLNIHSTLQKMTDDARAHRLRSLSKREAERNKD